MPEVYIGMGTNVGDREKNLLDALERIGSIDEVDITGKSSVLETEPVDYLEQPHFLNQVVKIGTNLEPDKLLEKLQSIESLMGRERGVPKGPRIIDLDILLYDDRVIETDRLTVPHPEILNRSFILEHLLELDPDLVNPVTRLKYREATVK